MLGQALDFGALCITPGRFVWTVFLDVMVLEGQGSLIDAVGTLLCPLAWVSIPCPGVLTHPDSINLTLGLLIH